MIVEHGAEERARLTAELASRQRRLVEAVTDVVALASDPNSNAGHLIVARLRMGQAIRSRRSMISQILQLPAKGTDAGRAAAEASAAKARLLDLAVPWLGFWSTARMLANQNNFVATMTPVLDDVIAIASEETAATLRYVEALAFPLPPRAAFG